jgi:amidase
MIRVVLFLLLTLHGHAAIAESRDKSAIVQMSVQELRTSLNAREFAAVEVVQAFLARIDALDDAGPRLNAVIEVNPDAVAIAQALDRKMHTDGPVGPLHGIPVVLKANIDTGDRMATSAGSLALADHRAANDAFHVR